MSGDYTIAYVEKPQESAWGIIGRGVGGYNEKQIGDDSYQVLCFALYAPDGEIVGGVVGGTHWDWFYVDLMWVREDLRGCGYGRQLLTLAEDEARKRGAKKAYLDTFSFQAPGFYQKYGYEVFGELKDFPVGHQRYYLTKAL